MKDEGRRESHEVQQLCFTLIIIDARNVKHLNGIIPKHILSTTNFAGHPRENAEFEEENRISPVVSYTCCC